MSLGAQHDGRRALLIGFGDASYLVRAGDVAAIDADGEEARLPVDATFDLASILHAQEESTHPERSALRLVVVDGVRRVAFRMVATVSLIEPAVLYTLPRLLVLLGCRPWVSGLALLDGATGENALRPTVCVDLTRLARETKSESEEK